MIHSFPINAFHTTCEYLTLQDLTACQSVNKEWKQMAGSSAFYLQIFNHAQYETAGEIDFSNWIHVLIETEDPPTLISKAHAVFHQCVLYADRLLTKALTKVDDAYAS